MSSVIETLASLVRLNSVNPEWNGPGESDVAAWIKQFLQTAELEVWEEEVLPGRCNIMARLPGLNPRRCILLEAHMDTVSAERMDFDPFDPVLENGRLRGRGSCDVKAGLAAMIHAIVAIKESRTPPPCDILFAAVVDEEHRYRGVLKLTESLRLSPMPGAAIVAEPTELRVVRANKGVLRWKICTHGKAAHSSKPKQGNNAITAMALVILALQEHFIALEQITHPLLGSGTGSIGEIRGGSQVNFVPDYCEIHIDRRLLPGETADSALAQCETVLSKLRHHNPDLVVTMTVPSLSDEAMETPVNSRIVEVATQTAHTLGLDSQPIGVPFGCDCTKLSRAGIPSIIFGPGSIEQAHTPNEYVESRQVEIALEFYRRLLLEFGTL